MQWQSALFVGILWGFCAELAVGVDHGKFRTCDQTFFCRQHRHAPSNQFAIVDQSLQLDAPGTSLQFLLHDALQLQDPNSAESKNERLKGRIQFVLASQQSVNPAIRVLLDEDWENPLDERKRWQNQDVLQPSATNLRAMEEITLKDAQLDPTQLADALRTRLFRPRAGPIGSASVVLAVTSSPFQLELFVANEKVLSTNSNGLFHFEMRRRREQASAPVTISKEEEKDVHGGKEIVDYGEDGLAIYADGTVQKKEETVAESESEPKTEQQEEEAGAWEESFGGHTDKKRFGPSSVGMDFAFYGATRNLYGIPEHASDFVLKNTLKWDGKTHLSDPYRLYNLDVFEYELDEPMALYGSIPLLVAPSVDNTVGVFWHNPSETFIDIHTTTDSQEEDQENAKVVSKHSHFISESGVIDLFLLVGPTNDEFFQQYTLLTGKPQLPPLFAIGYHQCRWNYKNEADVFRVNDGFDDNLIPYDVLWLDIEHTDGKRYFTWDGANFPHPVEMQQTLSRVGRKMVTIVDPHIKRDDNYYVHSEAEKLRMYVQDEDGKDFHGWCWPGDSSYVDYTNAKARFWWASLFRYSKYQGSTEDLYTWNDMNEPSVFNGPEVSMRKSCKNLDGIEHREWHNMYGMFLHQATMEGQMLRQLPSEATSLQVTTEMKRPFVLSRAFFAGSQRFGAIWTGDNAAKWDHLKYATKMLLSMNVAGLPFVGADVGGFFGNPDTELLTRWYQAAAFQPFFRAHAHHDSSRREPWLFGEPHTSRIRQAIRWRYALLPYLYTVFAESHFKGTPVMRPLWYHFQSDLNAFPEEDEFLLGKNLLIKPIVDAGVVETTVYLPTDKTQAKPTLWYTIFQDYARLEGGQTYEHVAAPLEYLPVFQRGGSILPRKNRVRRSSTLMKNDPITLSIALDHDKHAEGELFLDDEQTFAFDLQQKFTRVKLDMTDKLLSSALVGAANFHSNAWVERIDIYGLQNTQLPNKVLNKRTGDVVEFSYSAASDCLTLRKPGFLVTEPWQLEFV